MSVVDILNVDCEDVYCDVSDLRCVMWCRVSMIKSIQFLTS